MYIEHPYKYDGKYYANVDKAAVSLVFSCLSHWQT